MENACRNTAFPHYCDPHYAKQYDCYCWDCNHAGIPALAADAARWKYVKANFVGMNKFADDGRANFKIGDSYVARAVTIEDAIDYMIEVERRNRGGK